MLGHIIVIVIIICVVLVVVSQNRPGWGPNNIKDPPFFSRGSFLLLGSLCSLPGERHLSMPETGEMERNYYLFKSYTD